MLLVGEKKSEVVIGIERHTSVKVIGLEFTDVKGLTCNLRLMWRNDMKKLFVVPIIAF